MRPWTLALCAACAEEEVHTAELVLAEIRAGMNYTLAGFACTTSDARSITPRSRALLARAITQSATDPTVAVMRATLVIDYVKLDGYPRCRSNEIVNYCNEEGRTCTPMKPHRACFELDPENVPLGDLAGPTGLFKAGAMFADYVRTQLSGQIVTNGAPSEEAILRVVGTTETCAQLDARGGLGFDSERLLGCSYSCPLVPSAARGEILLDFEGVGPCEDDVIACAAEAFSPRKQTELPSIFR